MSGGKTNGVFRLGPKRERVDLTGEVEGIWVEINVTPSQNDIDRWRDEGEWSALAHTILEWNVVDADGSVLPISEASLRQMPLKALKQIGEAYQERALGIPKETGASLSPTSREKETASLTGSPSPSTPDN